MKYSRAADLYRDNTVKFKHSQTPPRAITTYTIDNQRRREK